jgi:transcription-repair coupling factor (superfamily II helicase)
MVDFLKLPACPEAGKTLTLAGLPESCDAFVLAQLMTQASVHVHISCADNRLRTLYTQFQSLCPSVRVITFPAWDCLPYDRVSPSRDILGERVEAFSIIAQPLQEPTLILTTVAAFLQRIPNPHLLAQKTAWFRVGQQLNLKHLSQQLTDMGYRRVETVREPAEFACRGGLVDCFPSGEDNPYRLDLFGDEIESIRRFDPLSQRSLDQVDSIQLRPASEVLLNAETIRQFRSKFREFFPVNLDQDPLYQAISQGQPYPGMEHWLPLFYEDMGHLLDYLPQGTTLSWSANSYEAVANRLDHIQEYYGARLYFAEANQALKAPPYYPLPPHLLYLQTAEVDQLIQKTGVLYFTPFKKPSADVHDLAIQPINRLQVERASHQMNLIDTLIQHLRGYLAKGNPTVIACLSKGTCERLATLLREHHFFALTIVADWHQVFKEKSASCVYLLPFELEQGFIAPHLTVISEQDIFGEKQFYRRQRRRRADLFIQEASALTPGDYVVHIDHGIGRYEGLYTLTVNHVPHDCVCLIYEGGDKLFVPVENLELLSRYGGEDSRATLDRLGSTAWQARKARVKEKLLAIADRLVNIAAHRHIQNGPTFEKPETLYEEFTARFPYNETEDQQRTIDEVLADLASGRPMDRLICGDVGFGKTEVALRAAFVVAAQGKQVAVITPTTLLCSQHYRHFMHRFQGFGIRIAQLSRLVPAKEARLTKEELSRGNIDIVIGTHGLLKPSTRFRDLGLVIIDEEQHFGVQQKERLKEIQSNVHILTLSATPIPRTLQMALTGVKDMSLITTPPIDRLAVRTFVLPYDPVVIREAIMREHFRGGQTFYVCPRIEDLELVAEELKKLVPEIKVVSIHGQLPSATLEAIMSDFYEKKAELLLSTNIIESGLDLPSVNTIIIHRADLFGLAQLYQLRGRVGRTKVQGYAYLTTPTHMPISTVAQRRLEVMQTLDTLGAGFQVASHDMDIRGTGNLLGAEQSGHIREVGVELYQHMLEEAVALLRTSQNIAVQNTPVQNTEVNTLDSTNSWVPQINLGLPVLIPESWVPDLGVRLSLYRRLSHCHTEEEIAEFRHELIDRFGDLPPEVHSLLEIMRLKQWCRRAHIEKIDTGDKGAVISFYNNTFPNTEGLLAYLQQQKGKAFVRPDQKVVFLRAWKDAKARQTGVTHIVRELVHLATCCA